MSKKSYWYICVRGMNLLASIEKIIWNHWYDIGEFPDDLIEKLKTSCEKFYTPKSPYEITNTAQKVECHKMADINAEQLAEMQEQFLDYEKNKKHPYHEKKRLVEAAKAFILESEGITPLENQDMKEFTSWNDVQETLVYLNAEHKKQREGVLGNFSEKDFESIELTSLELTVLRRLNPSDGEYREYGTDYEIVAKKLHEKKLVDGRGHVSSLGNKGMGRRRSIIGDMYLEWLDGMAKKGGENASENLVRKIVPPTEGVEPVCKAPAVCGGKKPPVGNGKKTLNKLSEGEMVAVLAIIEYYIRDNDGCTDKAIIAYINEMENGTVTLGKNALSGETEFGKRVNGLREKIQKEKVSGSVRVLGRGGDNDDFHGDRRRE